MLVFLIIPLLCLAKTKVFLIPHSHNDAGWLETIPQYYNSYVKHTLNNILSQLETKPNFKFCWSEVIFLSMYLEEHPQKKIELQKFINQHRFEIVGGGWVQNDEALPDFESVLRQHEAGFNYLQKELNISRVRVGWQLDPFGHSSLTPALFEKMGIESLFFARIDMRVKQFLEFTQNMEFVWKTEGFGAKKGVFVHILSDHYTYPDFADPDHTDRCFSQLPIVPEQIMNCINELETYVNQTLNHYKTNNVLIMLGHDFSYSNEYLTQQYFKFWDMLIRMDTKFDIKFATPSEYLDSIKENKVKWKVFAGDLLPLITEGSPIKLPNYKKVWTGFFSTKPHLKQKIFEVQKLVRVAEMFAAKVMGKEFFAYGLCATMHHDAITGTCRLEVYLDYLEMLEIEKRRSLEVLGEAFLELTGAKFTGAVMKAYKILYLVNPLNWQVDRTVHFVANTKYIRTYDTEGSAIKTQIVPYKNSFKIFFHQELQSTQLKVLFIEEQSFQCSDCGDQSLEGVAETLETPFLTIKMQQGMLYSIRKNNKTYNLNSKLFTYNTYNSGAYTFFPMHPASPFECKTVYKSFTGSVIKVASTEFTVYDRKFTQQILLSSQSDKIRLSFDIYAFPDSEIFMRFEYLNNRPGWFYLFNTANIMRKFFQYEAQDSKGTNYFPVNGAVSIDMETEFLHIFPSFPLGAGMAGPDAFELCLYRHPTSDDDLGIFYYVPDDFPVEHVWTLELGPLTPGTIWKSYLEEKASPIVLFQNISTNELTDNYSQAAYFDQSVAFRDFSSIFSEDLCNYFSSFVRRGDDDLLQVMNLCEENSPLKGFQADEERFLGGFKAGPVSDWITEGKLEWALGNASEHNVLKYPSSTGPYGLAPFVLSRFLVVQSTSPVTYTISESSKAFPSLLFLFIGFSVFLLFIAFRKRLCTRKIKSSVN